MAGRKALIAGGGIAGLATAIAVHDAGFHVEIFERAPELREIGAGLMIWPNGARSLRSLGVQIEALPVRELSISTWRGRRVNRYALEIFPQRYGFEPSFVHRADLQAALARRFGSDGLHLGAEVMGFKQDVDGVEVTLRDGSKAGGELLVGADGLRSSVRRELLNDGDPVYLGSTVWRGIAPASGIALDLDAGINWVGPGSEFLAFHLKGGRIYWAGVTKEPRGERAGDRGHKVDLIERFGDWIAPVPQLIEATGEADILRNDMYDRKPASHWSNGRVTLVGDAAHPMTPNAGQGACQALEDATALAAGLRQTADVTEAFRLYESKRLRRANRLVGMSRQATRAVQMDNRLLCALRDNIAFRVAQLVFPRTLDWMLKPDA